MVSPFNYTRAAQGYDRARYGAGTGAILLDDVRCRGSEARLMGCASTCSHNCAHSEDVGVRCKGGQKNCSVGWCNDELAD